MTDIIKGAGVDSVGTPGQEELAIINRFAKRELKAEEVYAFSVKLCDNEVDRDHERFPLKTLEELAGLFVGKSGIFDHQWSAQGQTARIYRTEVVREEEIITAAGEAYAYLKGWAYIPPRLPAPAVWWRPLVRISLWPPFPAPASTPLSSSAFTPPMRPFGTA